MNVLRWLCGNMCRVIVSFLISHIHQEVTMISGVVLLDRNDLKIELFGNASHNLENLFCINIQMFNALLIRKKH